MDFVTSIRNEEDVQDMDFFMYVRVIQIIGGIENDLLLEDCHLYLMISCFQIKFRETDMRTSCKV